MIRILLAGQGGQGVLSAGKFLAESGLHEGKEVSYLPAYGPEMRGGTANCSVIVSESPIASPLCTVSDTYAGRDDVTVVDIPANDLAMEAGNIRAANMVATGAFCALTGAVKEQSIINCLNEKFVGKPAVCDINARAFRAGIEAAKKQKK